MECGIWFHFFCFVSNLECDFFHLEQHLRHDFQCDECHFFCGILYLELSSVFSNVLYAIWSVVSSFWNSIKSTISNVMQSISSTVSSIWDNIRSAVSDKISGIKSTIQNGFDAAVGYIKGLASDAWNWGRDIIQGIIDGIQSAIGWLADCVTNVANTIRDFLHFSVPDKGPLPDYESWMPDFMKGLADGIDKS